VHQSAIFGPNRSDTLHSFEGFPRLCLPAQLELGCRKNLKRTQQQLILRWVNPQKCINGSLGISGGYWFEGMGCFAAVRRQPIFSTPVKTTGPDSPVVLTVKVLFCHLGLPIQEQGNRGRAELLSTPFRQYELKLREQLTDMFGGSGFDARRDIAASSSIAGATLTAVRNPAFSSERMAARLRVTCCGMRVSGVSHSPTPICLEIPATRLRSMKPNAPRVSFWTARSRLERGELLARYRRSSECS
jgi:hypothetical protein